MRRFAILALLSTLCTPVALRADDSERGPGNERGRGAKKPANECVAVSKDTRFRNYAYDHIVHMHNECEEAVTCTVSTDANPDETTVTLKKDEKRTLVTFRGSPAREFEARTDCKYKE